MKKKTQKLDVEFYINPRHNYPEHKLNILKECLIEWLKPENGKYYPFKDDEFKYSVDYVEFKEGDEHAVFHCYTNYDWVNSHNMFAEINGLISFFE